MPILNIMQVAIYEHNVLIHGVPYAWIKFNFIVVPGTVGVHYKYYQSHHLKTLISVVWFHTLV